jgi:hypothetical protein
MMNRYLLYESRYNPGLARGSGATERVLLPSGRSERSRWCGGRCRVTRQESRLACSIVSAIAGWKKRTTAFAAWADLGC